MKRLLATFISGLLLLVGCSSPPIGDSPNSPKDKVRSSTFELGMPIEFDGFTITVKAVKVVEGNKDDHVLKVVYDWTNTGDQTKSPRSAFVFTSFQDGVEVVGEPYSKEINSSIAREGVNPGTTTTGVESGVSIADMSKPLELEIAEGSRFNKGASSTMVIENLDSI